VALAIFDLDNTLIDRAACFRRWATELLARRRGDPAELDWLETADGDGFTPREAFVSAVRDRFGLHGSLDALVASYREQLAALVEPDPAVTAALAKLRASGWRVAIATNGTTAQQWTKVRRAGLDAHADAVVVSEEVGAAKPDRRVFEAAAQRCGAQLGDGGWMVGDCAVRDVAGGQRAGLHTVWMRRGRTWDPAARPPDATVDAVVDAVAVVLTTGSGPRG
jgi:HAD superfamily hydrolase (TIGR01549 family)